jgi:hypothetical protein
MGLDMYALTCDPSKVQRRELGGNQLPTWHPASPQDATTIHTWRKHPNLHQWMTDLYFRKEGLTGPITLAPMGPAFNVGQFVRITEHDLEQLEAAVKADALAKATGWYWGDSSPEDKKRDLAFIRKARKALKKGLVVFYSSWW